MRVQAKSFNEREEFNEKLEKANEFASQIGPDRLLNIAAVGPYGDVIIVWYWDENPRK